MEFKNDLHKKTYETVVGMMKEVFGDFARTVDTAPLVLVQIGSAMAQVLVSPWGDDDVVVSTRAYVVTDVEVTPELMRYLLEKNNNMRFGGFGLDGDGAVFFHHAILGSSMQKPELKSSVMAVVITADQEDDQIVARFGGRRAVDHVPTS